MILRMLMRHTALRRACSFAALIVVCGVALVVLPLGLLSGVSGLFGGQRRAARFSAFAAAYLRAELDGLRAVSALDPNDEGAHYALLYRLLDRLFRSALKNFHLEILPPKQGLELPEGPLLVFSRHAGPGDSFLLVYALLAAGRRPRVVLKEALTLDPLIDRLLSRTPNCLVGSSAVAREAAAERIGELAGSLGPQDALLLFPEGGNFTTARRGRLIARLRRRRAWRLLPVARSLDHILPAQPNGVFSAVDAAPPGTRVMFVAHTGLDHLESVAEAWHAVPLRRPVQAAWWMVPIECVPRDAEERGAWLKAEWARVDAWIDRRVEREEPGQLPDGGAEAAQQQASP